MPTRTQVRTAGYSRVQLMAMVALAGVIATLTSLLLQTLSH